MAAKRNERPPNGISYQSPEAHCRRLCEGQRQDGGNDDDGAILEYAACFNVLGQHSARYSILIWNDMEWLGQRDSDP